MTQCLMSCAVTQKWFQTSNCPGNPTPARKMHSSKNNPSTPVKVDFRIRKKQKCDPHFACSRNAHGHLTREFLRKQAQTKPRGQKEHLNETGLYSYRKTPSVWTGCLGNKMHGTANVQFVLVLLHCHQKLSGFFLDKFRNSSQVSHVVTGTCEQHGHFGVAAAIPTIIYWSL